MDVLAVNENEALTSAKYLVPLLVAALTAVVTWFTSRLVGKAAFQQAINDGFKNLLSTLQAQHAACEERLHALEQRYNEAKVKGAAERAQLRGEIINLTQAMESMKRFMRDMGIDIPEQKHPPVVHSTLGAVADDGAIILFQETDDDNQGL